MNTQIIQAVNGNIHAGYTCVWSGTVADGSTPSDVYMMFECGGNTQDTKFYIEGARSLVVGDVLVLGSEGYRIVSSGFAKLSAFELRSLIAENFEVTA